MESSYATQLHLSMGPALTQQSECTYETGDWQHAQGLRQLKTDSWLEKGKWTQSSTPNQEVRGRHEARYIFSVFECVIPSRALKSLPLETPGQVDGEAWLHPFDRT